jgi:hypothetical protein
VPDGHASGWRRVRDWLDKKRLAAEVKLFLRRNRGIDLLTDRIRADGLSYLNKGALVDLARVAERNERRIVDGIVIECGCAAGGSAIVLAAAKGQARPLFVYDVFSMIPPPSERDGPDVHERYEAIVSGQSVGVGDKPYYGYEEDLRAKVEASFERHGFPLDRNAVHLVEGLYEDTLHINAPVSLAHIDCDWYDSVMVCLERIVPHLSRGGTLVIDDYHSWSGARRAVNDYFARQPAGAFEFVDRSRVHIVRR